jgi:hypothetical protein
MKNIQNCTVEVVTEEVVSKPKVTRPVITYKQLDDTFIFKHHMNMLHPQRLRV